MNLRHSHSAKLPGCLQVAQTVEFNENSISDPAGLNLIPWSVPFSTLMSLSKATGL